MAKRIITISREYGSGGRFIGEEVARKLGIAYYDKDIIGQIAEQSGLSPEYIKENAELSPKKGLFAYAFAGCDIKTTDRQTVLLILDRTCTDGNVGEKIFDIPPVFRVEHLICTG